jgi:diguanylate cyclase (GGDEF)-like protein
MIDLDKFKSINDNFGHKVGDDILIKTASVLKENIDKDDFFCRMGGDEFVVIFYNKSKEFVEEKMELILKDIGRLSSGKMIVRASAGIANNKEQKNIEKVLDRSDKMMYLSKKTKNKINFYD